MITTPGEEPASDVVVIGGGLAGMVTALELLDAAKRAVLLDLASRKRFGGVATWSFGGIFFVDSPEQRKNRIKDSVGELDPNDTWPYRLPIQSRSTLPHLLIVDGGRHGVHH